MNLQFNKNLAIAYKSNSQIARKLTERWVLENSYCPNCGALYLNEFENNRPVADFYCASCNEEFELKSKTGKLTKIITDGAYATMIQRISSNNNPNLFFLSYSKEWKVNNFIIIPKQFFTTEIIIKRLPLASSAVRAGWIGCNIDASKIPEVGKIFIVKNSQIVHHDIVKKSFNKTLFLRAKNKDSKGWLLDVMTCVDLIKGQTFNLDEIYNFEKVLKQKHPNNNFIKDKIRQQLQVLRDMGFIDFAGRGNYIKLSHENI